MIIRIDYQEPDVMLDLWGGTSGTFSGLDRFGRIIDQQWLNYSGSPADLDRYKYGYDRNSNRTWKENAVSKALGTPVYLDEFYTYDNLNRLTMMQRGQLTGSPPTGISGTPGKEQDWTLDKTGNWIHATLIFVQLLVLLFFASAAAAAENVGPQLEVVPSTVEHPGVDGPVEVLLVLRNPTTQPLHDLQISTFPEAYSRRRIAPTTMPARILPNDQFAWSIQLPEQLPSPIPDAMHIRLDYRTGAGDAELRQVLTSQIEVTPRKFSGVDDVAKVEILPGPEGLRDGQKTTLIISATNKSYYPIRITGITVPSGGYVSIVGGNTPAFTSRFPMDIPTRQTQFIPVELQADASVAPGKHTVGLVVDMEWGPPEHKLRGNFAVTREISLSVMGESDVLSALGVPSLLVLPGYLILIAYFAARVRWAEQESLSLWKEITKPSLIVLALTLSFAVALAYQAVFHRSYLLVYGWTDIVALWFSSIAFGAIVGGSVRYRLWRRSEQTKQLQAARTYLPADSPTMILEKIGRNGMNGWKLPYVTLRTGAELGRLYTLPRLEAAAGMTWVIPQILVAPTKNEAPEVAKLDAAINDPTLMTARELSEFLIAGEAAGIWQVKWSSQGSIKQPAEIADAQLSPAQGAAAVVAWQ